MAASIPAAGNRAQAGGCESVGQEAVKAGTRAIQQP